MFISVLELFKIGIGPSSSHTMGPMVAAQNFLSRVNEFIINNPEYQNLKTTKSLSIRCTLKGSLSFTGKGHATDRAIALGLHGYSPEAVAAKNLDLVISQIWDKKAVVIDELIHKEEISVFFNPVENIIFDRGEPLKEHPNGMIFELLESSEEVVLSETYFSIGGGFVSTIAEINQVVAPLRMESAVSCTYAFDSADSMLAMSIENSVSVAEMKRKNELDYISESELHDGLDAIWDSMQRCIKNGLGAEGVLPGGLGIQRRAKSLFQHLEKEPETANLNDWLCAYAMAVNEENAAGHMVVTAPTNGAAGVIPAVLYYFVQHENGSKEQIRDYLLTASAIGGLIKHRSSISGAEVGCQGEVGSAAAMAAAGLCAVRGGSTEQIENAAEIALEHHLGMTCDPVDGLVQVPCIERNGFGAIKAYTAASLSLRGSGEHFMPLDSCIAAMKKTGEEMSHKYKETALGGLAVSFTEC